MKIARHRGMKKAIVAHRMWVGGIEFRWTGEVAVAPDGPIREADIEHINCSKYSMTSFTMAHGDAVN